MKEDFTENTQRQKNFVQTFQYFGIMYCMEVIQFVTGSNVFFYE